MKHNLSTYFVSISGSIIVTFTIQGSFGNVTLVTSDICGDLSSGQTVSVGNQTLTLDTYMTVDGRDYYSQCGSEVSQRKRFLKISNFLQKNFSKTRERIFFIIQFASYT